MLHRNIVAIWNLRDFQSRICLNLATVLSTKQLWYSLENSYHKNKWQIPVVPIITKCMKRKKKKKVFFMILLWSLLRKIKELKIKIVEKKLKQNCKWNKMWITINYTNGNWLKGTPIRCFTCFQRKQYEDQFNERTI